MSYSLTDLPSEVLEQILLFVPTPRALCRIGTTCQSLFETVNTNERVWDRLYKMRWAYSVVNTTEQASFSCRDYQTKHVQDAETLERLLRLSETLEHEQDYGLGSEFENESWTELCSELGSFDILRSVANNNRDLKLLFPNKNVSLIARCLAAQAARDVHFRECFEQLVTQKHIVETHTGTVSDCALEESLLLISESQRKWRELLSSNTTPKERMNATKQKLDDLGRNLQSRINECNGHFNTMDIICTLSTMLVDDLCFLIYDGESGVYYATMDDVLESKRGIPTTLAVICQSILRRVGISVFPVHGIRGRVMLGLPVNEVVAYVDVFGGCQVFSSAQVNALPTNSTTLIDSPVLIPLGERILEMICIQILLSYDAMLARHPSSMRTVWAFHAGGAAASLAHFYLTDNMDSALHMFLDPEIFRHYNLINDASMNRHNEAPWFADIANTGALIHPA